MWAKFDNGDGGLAFIDVGVLESLAADRRAPVDDERRALKALRAGAEAGISSAQVALALMHLDGLGDLPKSVSDGLRWYRKAAEKDVDAQRGLGLVYMYGHHGVKEDRQEAARWFQKAVAKGDAESRLLLNLLTTGQSGN